LSNRSINYVINFVLETTFLVKKVYSVFCQEKKIIKTYLNNIKDKNQIRNSISQYAISTLIVKKSNKELRICVNYRNFNTLTIKNRNILLLIRKILQQLYKT